MHGSVFLFLAISKVPNDESSQVYGPHCAAMFIRRSTRQTSLNPISHYFITDPTNQYQLGGPGYELTYAVSRVLQYFLALPNSTFNSRCGIGFCTSTFSTCFQINRSRPSIMEIMFSRSMKLISTSSCVNS